MSQVKDGTQPASELPGLGAKAPRPGEVLSASGGLGLKIPNTAQAVRAVDDTGTITGLIPVVGKATASNTAGPEIPGVNPIVVKGANPVVPQTPEVPIPKQAPAAAPVRHLPTPGAPIPPSTTGMIPSVAPVRTGSATSGAAPASSPKQNNPAGQASAGNRNPAPRPPQKPEQAPSATSPATPVLQPPAPITSGLAESISPKPVRAETPPRQTQPARNTPTTPPNNYPAAQLATPRDTSQNLRQAMDLRTQNTGSASTPSVPPASPNQYQQNNVPAPAYGNANPRTPTTPGQAPFPHQMMTPQPPIPGQTPQGRPAGYPPQPRMPGVSTPAGMAGQMPMPPRQPYPAIPYPYMPQQGQPGMPPVPYGMWRQPGGPYGMRPRPGFYGMPGAPGAQGNTWPYSQPVRASRREHLEEIEARQIEELREAEAQVRRAEIEAIISTAAQENQEISEEDLDNIDWDDFAEPLSERIIRKAGRWGETLLMLGQAARWALVVLVTVAVVVILVYALDRSAVQEIAMGQPGQSISANVNTTSSPPGYAKNNTEIKTNPSGDTNV